MRYTVVWLPDAETLLAALYNSAPDKQSFTAAADRIEILLRDDPERHAEPQGKFYTLTVEPVAVLFHVDPGDCMVRVLSVKRTD
jgi:hypothetical protein